MSFKLKAVAAAVLAVGAFSTANALTIVGNSPTTLASEVLPATGTTTVNLNPIGFNSTVQGVIAGNNYTLKLTLSSGVWGATNANTILAHIDPSQAAFGNAQLLTIVSGLGTNVIVLAPTGGALSAAPAAGSATPALAAAPAAISSTAANTLFKFNGLQAIVTSADLVATGINDDGCGPTFKNISVKGQYLNNSGTEVDLPVGTLNQDTIITAQQGITGAVTSATSPVIDVTSPSLNKFFVGGVTSVPVGSYVFNNASGSQSDNAAIPADYVIGTGVGWTDGGHSITINASSGFATGSTFTLSSTAACPGVPVGAPTTVITGNQAVVTQLLSVPGFTNTAAMPLTVCYNVLGTSAIPASTLTGFAVSKRTGVAPLSDFAGGATCQANLTSLKLNGGLIKVRNYSGASLVPFGWKQYTRIINSGATATPISGYFQYGDGTQSAAAVLVPTIAAGGNVTLSNIAIEALLPLDTTKTTTTNARLVITSNNDSIRVQNYQVTPNTERWMESSGGQDDMATHTQQ